MTRLLALSAALLLLTGCASQAGTASAPNQPALPSGHPPQLSAAPPVPFTPVASGTVARAHRVHISDVATAAPRIPRLNCGPAAASGAAVRVTPSPATSHLLICLRVGQTLLVGRTSGISYHWSKPQMLGAARVLRPTPLNGAVAAFRARTPGMVALMSIGSPPAGSLAASFQWLAKVLVR